MISAIVLTKNEERQIEICLKSVKFADEIIVIDNESTDQTLAIAKKYTNKIYKQPFTNFSKLRNFGKEKAKNTWVLYVDADEEVTEELSKEIHSVILGSENNIAAYFITRRNFYLGKEWPIQDKVERLFKKENLLNWYGEVHESPKVEGEKGQLKNVLIHRTHNNLEEMLTNTIAWSDFEAKARFRVNHPKVTWWRIFKMMMTSFWDCYIKQKGFTVGTVGLIESGYQAFSTFITYSKLWEMQRNND